MDIVDGSANIEKALANSTKELGVESDAVVDENYGSRIEVRSLCGEWVEWSVPLFS